jgi:alpha-galactosidase
MSQSIGDGTPTWGEPGRAAVIRFRMGELAKVMELQEPNHARQIEGIRFIWRWQEEPAGYRMWVRVTHRGEQAIALDTIDVLTAPVPTLGAGQPVSSVYQNGWQSWSPAFARHLGNGLHSIPATPDYGRKHQPHDQARAVSSSQRTDGADISSEWVTVLSARKGEDHAAVRTAALLVGFVTAADQLTEVRVRADGSALVARCHCDGVRIEPGDSISSETLVVRTGPDGLSLLEAWADEIGQEMKARVPSDSPTGWCSWYAFYGENTAEDVTDNLAAIEENALPLDVLVIDDGYQTAIGDWFSLDDDRFPDGLEPVTGEIRRAGHRTGIWTAPFGASADSQLVTHHPGWLLRDESDQPVLAWMHQGGPCYALDCTHPEVLGWLGKTFKRMRQAWGISFFKIDFLFAAALAGRHHDPTATRAQALRRGVKAIRSAIGGRSFLLGCGAPLGPCVGLVDGMRVGPDVDPNWYPIWRNDLSAVSTQNALRNVVTRAPLHGRLWVNDPDCLLVRQREENAASPPSMDLVLNEVRTLSALVALSGGVTLDSDDLTAIDPGRLKYVRQTLPPTGISARPLDLFEHELPSLFVLPVERSWGRWWIAGVINWDDRTTETTVRLAALGLPSGRYHVFHYWRRRYLGVTHDTMTVRRHQPHETAVLLFKPVSDRPDVLTTTFHVCQGVVELVGYQSQITNAKSHVEVTLEKAGQQFGRVFFTVPRGWRVVEAEVDGRKQAPVTEAHRVVSLGLTLQERATVRVDFERAP